MGITGQSLDEPEDIDIKQYLPYQKLLDLVAPLKSIPFSKITNNQAKLIFIYRAIHYGLEDVSNAVVSYYNSEHEREIIEVLNFIPDSDDSYKGDIAEFFLNIFSNTKEEETTKLIESISKEIEDEVNKEVAKVEITNNRQSLLERRNEELCSIIRDIPFYQEWLDWQKPSIKDINVLAKWSDKKEYPLLLKKLLFAYSLEQKYVNTPYLDKKIEDTINLRNQEKTNTFNEAYIEAKEWIIKCFSGHITKEELCSLLLYIREFFETEKIKTYKPIKVNGNINDKDISTALWTVWKIYNAYTDTNISRDAIAEFAKKQFPIAFKNKTKETINKHLSDNEGKIIKALPKRKNK